MMSCVWCFARNARGVVSWPLSLAVWRGDTAGSSEQVPAESAARVNPGTSGQATKWNTKGDNQAAQGESIRPIVVACLEDQPSPPKRLPASLEHFEESWHHLVITMTQLYQFHFISQHWLQFPAACDQRKFHSTGAQDLVAKYLYSGMCSSSDFLKTFLSHALLDGASSGLCTSQR